MTEAELDTAYSALCRKMTDLGESNTPLLLARFALLAMAEIGDAASIARLIQDAAHDLKTESPSAGGADHLHR